MHKIKKLLDNKTLIGNLILLVVAVFYLYKSQQLPQIILLGDAYFSASTLPTLIAICAILCGLLQLVIALRNEESLRPTLADIHWRPLILLLLLMVAYAALFELLGFVVASSSFLFFACLSLGERRWLLSLAISVGLVVSMWILLSGVFGLYLDPGDLYRWLAGV